MRSRRAIRCCAARSAITSRNSAGPIVRFFACEEDLSHESPDAPLPDAVATGAEPFWSLGRSQVASGLDFRTLTFA